MDSACRGIDRRRCGRVAQQTSAQRRQASPDTDAYETRTLRSDRSSQANDIAETGTRTRTQKRDDAGRIPSLGAAATALTPEPQFRRQHCVAGFWLEIYCHERRLAIEVDGPVHQDQEDYDAARTVILNGLGITVVRFTNEQVLNETVAVLARIEVVAGPPGSGRACRKT